MMHGREKSDPAIVAVKPANKAGQPGCGVGGAKGGGRGERGTGQHAPGAGPGKRVPGAGPRTASRKAEEEGTVHRAPPPHQPRPAPDGVPRSQAECRPGVDGLTWQDYEADLDADSTDLHDRVHRGAYRALPSRRGYIPKADGQPAAAGHRGVGGQDRPTGHG